MEKFLKIWLKIQSFFPYVWIVITQKCRTVQLVLTYLDFQSFDYPRLATWFLPSKFPSKNFQLEARNWTKRNRFGSLYQNLDSQKGPESCMQSRILIYLHTEVHLSPEILTRFLSSRSHWDVFLILTEYWMNKSLILFPALESWCTRNARNC